MRFATERLHSSLGEDFYLNNVQANKGVLLNRLPEAVIANYVAPSNHYIIYVPKFEIFNGSKYWVAPGIRSLCVRYYDTNVYIDEGFLYGDMLRCNEQCGQKYPYKYQSYVLCLSETEFNNFLFKESLGDEEVTTWLSEKVVRAIEYKRAKGYNMQ